MRTSPQFSDRWLITPTLPGLLIALLLLSTSSVRAEDESAFDRGYELMSAGEHRKAIAEFDRAIAANPRLADAYMCRAHALLHCGEHQRALRDCNVALRIDGTCAQTFVIRGECRYELRQFRRAILDLSEALHLDPTAQTAWSVRGYCFFVLREYKRAIEDLTEALKIDAPDYRTLTVRAQAYLYLGELSKGRRDLLAAIKADPHDPAKTYRPFNDRVKLDVARFWHGKLQVAAMLKARPRMERHDAWTSVLAEWAARKFAGEDLGKTIDWMEKPSRKTLAFGWEAWHRPPLRGRRGAVYVVRRSPSNGKLLGFERLWSRAIFELHNIAGVRDFERVYGQGARGTITAEQFVEACWEIEHRAARQTRAFFAHVFLPWAKENKVATDPANWYVDWYGPAREIRSYYNDRQSYPWVPYETYYDDLRRWTLTVQEKHGERIAYDLRVLAVSRNRPRTSAAIEDLGESIVMWLGQRLLSP